MSVDPVSLGIKVGLTALSMGLQMMNKIEGPRLDTLDVSLADYGTPIRRMWGVRRLDGCPIIWAKKIREEKVESKTKGGKYAEYKYYGTWAVLLCDHEIDAIRRLWFDKHLVYQVKDAGPIGMVMSLSDNPLGLPREKLSALNARFYLGTEDQEPDPTMEAWCEDRYGADSCPAYRGCAYIVFKNIPLEKFGNRIPQISVEAISDATDAFPSEEREGFAGTEGLAGLTFSADGTKMVTGFFDQYDVWDVPTRTRLLSGTLSAGGKIGGRVGLFNDGTVWVGGEDENLYVYGLDFQGGAVLADEFTRAQKEVWVVSDGDGVEYAATVPYSLWETFSFGGAEYDMESLTGVPWTPLFYKRDSYGDIWALGKDLSTVSTTLYFCRLKGANREVDSFHAVTGLDLVGTSAAVWGAHYNGHWIVRWGSTLYAIEDETFTVETSAAVPANTGLPNFANHGGAPTIWLGYSEYNIADLSIARTVDPGDWGLGSGTTAYDSLNHALITGDDHVVDPDQSFWMYLDRVGSAGVPLSTIIDDVAGWCGGGAVGFALSPQETLQ